MIEEVDTEQWKRSSRSLLKGTSNLQAFVKELSKTTNISSLRNKMFNQKSWMKTATQKTWVYMRGYNGVVMNLRFP
jgi:hypothetical protein